MKSWAENRQVEVAISFPVSQTAIDPDFADNSAQLAILDAFLHELDSVEILDVISINGYASPEGSYAANMRLARNRAQAVIDYMIGHSKLTEENLRIGESLLSWSSLRPLVAASQMGDRATLLAWIDVAIADHSEPTQLDVLKKMQSLRSGAVWGELKRDFFPQLRTSHTNIEVNVKLPEAFSAPEMQLVEEAQAYNEEENVNGIDIERAATDSAAVAPIAQTQLEPRYDCWHLKTNAIGWGMLVSNIAVEYDFAPHWSAALPIYYSGLNYFKHTLKFRTFTIQPELRYWLKTGDLGNHGLFAGAHFGLGYFNYATDGEYRIQDHNGRHPALGGGLSVGYRMAIKGRLSLEFSIGAGAYHARYDKYVNDYNGPRVVADRHTTWLGIDQAAVSLVYTFKHKKGGAR